MGYIGTTFAHGNGPFCRTIDLGLAINDEFERRGFSRMPIIVPLVYGDRQRRIMMEDFGAVLGKDPEAILLDGFHGDILNQLFFKGGSYQRNLELLLENQPRLEDRLEDYLNSVLELETFDGREIKIRGGEVEFEISHNPRVATGYDNSFYTTIGYFSEILEKAAQEAAQGRLNFDSDLLRDAVDLADRIENDRDFHFMPEPFVFSFEQGRGKWEKEIFTPPFIHCPRRDIRDVPGGMYVMVTGIDGLSGLFDGIERFGMKLYCPPFIDLPGADNTHKPDFVSNPNIKYQFARSGWSSVWWSHMTDTPLITPAYSQGDDPEIYFNERTIRQLGLGTVFTAGEDPRNVLRDADSIRPSLTRVNKKLLSNYNTLDGINYTARAIVDVLEGKDIEAYKEKNPCLS